MSFWSRQLSWPISVLVLGLLTLGAVVLAVQVVNPLNLSTQVGRSLRYIPPGNSVTYTVDQLIPTGRGRVLANYFGSSAVLTISQNRASRIDMRFTTEATDTAKTAVIKFSLAGNNKRPVTPTCSQDTCVFTTQFGPPPGKKARKATIYVSDPPRTGVNIGKFRIQTPEYIYVGTGQATSVDAESNPNDPDQQDVEPPTPTPVTASPTPAAAAISAQVGNDNNSINVNWDGKNFTIFFNSFDTFRDPAQAPALGVLPIRDLKFIAAEQIGIEAVVRYSYLVDRVDPNQQAQPSKPTKIIEDAALTSTSNGIQAARRAIVHCSYITQVSSYCDIPNPILDNLIFFGKWDRPSFNPAAPVAQQHHLDQSPALQINHPFFFILHPTGNLPQPALTAFWDGNKITTGRQIDDPDNQLAQAGRVLIGTGPMNAGRSFDLAAQIPGELGHRAHVKFVWKGKTPAEDTTYLLSRVCPRLSPLLLESTYKYYFGQYGFGIDAVTNGDKTSCFHVASSRTPTLLGFDVTSHPEGSSSQASSTPIVVPPDSSLGIKGQFEISDSATGKKARTADFAVWIVNVSNGNFTPSASRPFPPDITPPDISGTTSGASPSPRPVTPNPYLLQQSTPAASATPLTTTPSVTPLPSVAASTLPITNQSSGFNLVVNTGVANPMFSLTKIGNVLSPICGLFQIDGQPLNSNIQPCPGAPPPTPLLTPTPAATLSPTPPTVDVKVNGSDTPPPMAAGQKATMTWTSTGADFCNASGNWSGSYPLSGTDTSAPLGPGTYTYRMICEKGSAQVSDSVTLTVSTGATPTLIPNPSPTPVANSADLILTVSNAPKIGSGVREIKILNPSANLVTATLNVTNVGSVVTGYYAPAPNVVNANGLLYTNITIAPNNGFVKRLIIPQPLSGCAGTPSIVATVSSNTPDPNSANNTAPYFVPCS